MLHRYSQLTLVGNGFGNGLQRIVTGHLLLSCIVVIDIFESHVDNYKVTWLVHD